MYGPAAAAAGVDMELASEFEVGAVALAGADSVEAGALDALGVEYLGLVGIAAAALATAEGGT